MIAWEVFGPDHHIMNNHPSQNRRLTNRILMQLSIEFKYRYTSYWQRGEGRGRGGGTPKLLLQLVITIYGNNGPIVLKK